ncbi:MAG: hypothetical protein KJ968_03855 [Nanoarchaeota archaeon]|nr:hypothetical protein [Nanoarchaeota archaeon]
MQLINYSLISLISFSGLLIGMVLAFTAKEELEPGKKYFLLLQKLTLLLILIFLLNFFNVILYLRITIYILFIFLMTINIKSQIIYPALAAVFFLSSKNPELFITNSILIFLYGFPTGSLFAKKLIKKRKSFVLKNIFLNYFWFVIITIILKLIF